jgi:uncharacterized iron-regulated membrane protein
MLFVICWSGTIAVFSHEIDWLLNPDLRAQPLNGEVPFVEAKAVVEAARPGWEIQEIKAPRYRGFAMEVLANAEPDVTHRIYVDPVTLQVLGDTSYFNVQRFFRSFHMALFEADFIYVLGIPIGYFVVLLFAFPLLASMVTPLVFYRRWWRSFFKLETGKGATALWSGIHKLTGVWSLWFIALMCLTSFWYLAEWFIPYPDAPEAPDVQKTEMLDADVLLARAEQAFPELQIQSLGFYAANANVFYASGQDGTALTRGRAHVALDIRTGEVLDLYHQGRSGIVARLMETVDVLHFGTFGGLWSQMLYFFFGLFLSALCLTGAYLQAGRQARKKHPTAIRNPVLGAYGGTIALILLAVIGGWQQVGNEVTYGGWPEFANAATAFVVAWCVTTIGILTIWMCTLR